MRLRLDGRTYRGRAVDLRHGHPDTDPMRVGRALDLDPADPLAVVSDSPPSLHRVLASAARTRGHEAPQADRIATIRRLLAADDSADPVDAPNAPDLAAARERAASAAADVERLRERVATARGRLQAVREAGGEATAAEREHRDAARELAAAETDRVAAEQALAAASERARACRSASRRTLRLRDELSNRRSEARRELARRIYPEFAAAVDRLPGEARPGTGPSEFAGDGVTGHLAAVTVADRDAPVVLGAGAARFGGPAEATTRLGVPVVQL